jgi:uncharacterized protein
VTVELPMFPLGTVLFPGALLPLHVFEPRYRALTVHCLAAARGAGRSDPDGGSGELGIVLIERGSEVGGGDVRFDVGTRARIVSAVPLEAGLRGPNGEADRWFLVLRGVDRIRVVRWLGEEPFPRAEVLVLAEDDGGRDAVATRDRVERLLRQALALATELGEPTAAPATVALDPAPAAATWQAAAVAPVGVLDAQRVLATPGVDDRLRLLEELLQDEVAVFEHRVHGG